MSFKISSTMHTPAPNSKPAPKKAPFTAKPLLVKIQRFSEKTGKGIRTLFKSHPVDGRDKPQPISERKVAAGKSNLRKQKEIQPSSPKEKTTTSIPSKSLSWLPKVMWGVSAVMVLIVVYLVLQFFSLIPAVSAATTTQIETTSQKPVLPAFTATQDISLERITNPKTTIPDRTMDYILRYSVQPLEGVYSIASKFKLKPETILWSNEQQLRSDPNTIPVNSVLYIPPVDGVYYQWKKGDTLESVAGKYKVDPSAILTWPSNRLDLTDPQIEPGQYVMIPGGVGTPIEWVVSIPYQAHSGANKSIADQCNVTGYYAWSGGFIWPTTNHLISGNDFWAGHLGIDIGAYLGSEVWASSAGVVIWAGNMSGGYGNVVVLEHDNGAEVWDTLYAHLSQINVHCGDQVTQRQVIGLSGSSGNSTGPHLHFEVRLNGSFVNPHYVVGY